MRDALGLVRGWSVQPWALSLPDKELCLREALAHRDLLGPRGDAAEAFALAAML